MSTARGAPRIRNIIAERVFQRADGKEVRAVVGRPRKGRRDWASLLMMKADFGAMIQEIEASPEYRVISQAFRGHPWFTKGNSPRLRKRM